MTASLSWVVLVVLLLAVRCSATGALVSPAPPLTAQRPGEGPAAHREVVAGGRGVQVRPATGRAATGIGHHGRVALGVRADDEAQQLVAGGPLPTSHTRPDGPAASGIGRGCRHFVWVDHHRQP